MITKSFINRWDVHKIIKYFETLHLRSGLEVADRCEKIFRAAT